MCLCGREDAEKVFFQVIRRQVRFFSSCDNLLDHFPRSWSKPFPALFNTLATSHIYLLLFKLKLNQKFSPSFALATFQMLHSHVQLIPYWTVQTQNMSIIPGISTGHRTLVCKDPICWKLLFLVIVCSCYNKTSPHLKQLHFGLFCFDELFSL